MTDYRVIRCIHDGLTLKRLPLLDVREPGDHDFRHAFKVRRIRKWLAQVRAAQWNVIRFGTAVK